MSENPDILISKELIDYCSDPFQIELLNGLDVNECRQILPFLSRIWLRSSCFLDESDRNFKLAVLEKINTYEDTNKLSEYLSLDFNQIYEDVIRHLSARKKSQSLSVYECLEFEEASPVAKLLMISNILLNGNIRNEENIICKYSSIDYSLFDTEIYFQELSDLLCIIHAELGEVISLSQFVYTLLHAQSIHSVNYILNLIANSVDSLFQVLEILLDGCTCIQIDAQRHKCLIAISSIWPCLTNYIITECIRRHILPITILNLAKKENLIHVLLTIFQFEFDRNWFVQFLRSPNKSVVEKQAVDSVREELVASCYRANSEKHLDLQLFKLYSGLRMFAGLKFNEAEIKALIDLILTSGEITVAICFLLIYPPLYEAEVNSQRIIHWIKEKFSQAQQSILLIAVYCSSYQLHLLNEYVSNMIGFKFQLKSNSMTNIKNLFQQVFPDDSLFSEYSRNLPITRNLNAKMSQLAQTSSSESSSNTLGIYFLNQCIKTNAFVNRRHFDVSDWLIEQIKQCSQPIHPVIINLVNNYITQIFNLNILTEYRLKPLSSEKIHNFYRENYSKYDESMAAKLIFYYYLLTYESKRRETVLAILSVIQNPSSQSGNPVSVAIAAALNSASSLGCTKLIPSSLESLISFKYSSEIFNFTPINHFLNRAQEPQFAIIHPSLLKLTINMFTQLCQVEHCLYEPSSKSINKIDVKLKNLDFLLDKLKSFKKLVDCCEYTRSDAHICKILWFKAYSLHGRKLSLHTSSILLDVLNLTYDEIYSNPLILLKSENLEIYKCGPLFEVLLYILKECLMANKNQMEYFLVENHLNTLNESKVNQLNQTKTLKERQELKNSLIDAQDTAVIQILLDLFLMIKNKSNQFFACDVQGIICSFIHQMFIDNMNLAELVHFQGYPKELMPILVHGVPSMHICLDFLPKLLSHSDLEKQIFGINLAAELCEKYPIIRTFNVAKLSINVAFTVLQSKALDERKKFFEEIISSIVTFYTKLPPLTQECMSLIINAVHSKSIDVDSLPPLIDFEF